MTHFLDISLPEYVGSDENIEETSSASVCVCCLSQESVFINLLSCKHSAFLEYFFKYKMECHKNYVCIRCHTMLQKIDKFKQQVEECIQILNDQIPLKPKAHNLQISKTEITSVANENENKTEVDEVQYEIATEVKIEHDDYCDDIDVPLAKAKQQHRKRKKKVIKKISKSATAPVDDVNDCKPEVDEVHYEMATELKVEHDLSDDLDMPLAEIKKRKKKTAKTKKPPKKRSIAQTVEQKYAGKLRTVTLTEEEMLNEREELRREEKYLRLPYKCETCIVGFEFEMAWTSHVLKQHNKTGFTCDLCKSVLSSASSLKEHSRRHLRRYECAICKKRYRDEYSAVQHFNELHGAAGAIMVEFQCPLCNFTTRSHRSLRYHRSKHKQEKDKCNICGNEFTNKSSLKIHMYTLHKQSSRVYKCEPCGKVYRGKSGLFTHMGTVHEAADRRAYCLQCCTYYRTAHNLAHHLRTHSSHITDVEKRFGCDECGSRFITKSTLKSHIEWEHLEIRNNRCNKCSKAFRSRTTLKKHVEFVHEKKRPPRNKICDYCGQGFTTAAILRSHIRTHTGERPHRCTHCGATFAHSSALYNHNRLLHNPDRDRRHYTLHKQSSRVYKCEPCGKVYRGKSGLFTHMGTVHEAADRRAYCLQCCTYYRTAHNLAHHLRTHSSHITDVEKRFGCDECGSRFITKSTLKSHIEWEHLEIRNNRCNKCSKAFRSRTTLKKHVEFVHEKKRPPRNKICDYCGQGFTTAAILRSHIRTHTGERPHRCTHCGATFAHSSALYNHNRLLHNPDRDRRH